MRLRHPALVGTLCTLALYASSGRAIAQDHAIAVRQWQIGSQTAGPNGTDYEPPNDAQDLWIIEDFGIATDALLTRFESYGTIFPAPLTVIDVTVRIYDGLPTTGTLILQSTPGSGHVIVNGNIYRIAASFGSQYLRAGTYNIVWTVETHSPQLAIFWAQAGPPTIGAGGDSDGLEWNPGLGWNWPTGAIRPVPADLQGDGQTGVNFALYGMNACYANCDNSSAQPALNVLDFTCFLQKFAAGDAYANCDGSSTPPTINILDFTCFLQKFAAGCP